MVVIIASNRADLIDPAILRPGRIDRKIRVRRTDRAAAVEIYKLYISEALPLAEPREDLVEALRGNWIAGATIDVTTPEPPPCPPRSKTATALRDAFAIAAMRVCSACSTAAGTSGPSAAWAGEVVVHQPLSEPASATPATSRRHKLIS